MYCWERHAAAVRNGHHWLGIRIHPKIQNALLNLPNISKLINQQMFYEVVVSNILYFHPNLGKWSILTSIFFRWVETSNLPSSTPLARRMRWSRTWNFARKQRLRCPHSSENDSRLGWKRKGFLPTSFLGVYFRVLANDVVCVVVFFRSPSYLLAFWVDVQISLAKVGHWH